MSRERALKRRLRTLASLDEAIGAMRALSAHHFRRCRAALPAVRAYAEEVARAVTETGISRHPVRDAPPGLLVIASDMGLCGDYNVRVARAAEGAREQLGPGPTYVAGRRARRVLEAGAVTPVHSYDVPTSIDGLPRLLLQLAQDLLDDYLSGRTGALVAVSASFTGAGHCEVHRTQLLPVESPVSGRLRPTGYESRAHLVGVVVREYLYSSLSEILSDALASEHGMRLIAVEGAKSWLEDTTTRARRGLASLQREISTQEVLDIAAGARMRSAQPSD